jgi:dipeptidyl aminopeptidase/acylaminoacyl peptidase
MTLPMTRTQKIVRQGMLLAAAAILLCTTALPGRAQSAAPKPAAQARAKSSAKAASPLDAVLKTLFAAHTFESVAITPDGTRVAWVEKLTGGDGAPTGNSTIYVADARSGGGLRRITADTAGRPHAESSPVWSPDGKQIAFFSDAAKAGQLQLYVARVAGGEAERVTNVKGFLAAPAWSPDGKTIALLFTENATRAAGPLVAETPQTGEIVEAVSEQRLALVNAVTGSLRQISPADLYVYEYDWSPDGQRFAVTAAHGNGDNNWWVAQLYTLDAGDGAMKSIYKPTLQIAKPAWSPDGQQVAFIEGLMSDEDSVGGDIFAVSAAGGAAKNVTPEMKASVSSLHWTPEGKILFAEYIQGDAGVATADPANGRIELLWRGPGQLTAGAWGPQLSLARDAKTAAAVRSSFGAPPEIWAGPIGAWKQITRRNAGLQPAWGEAKSIHWKSEGYDVQGWLLYPRDFDPAKKYPLVVHVHGGPGAATESQWPGAHDYPAALAASGYFVLHPNPRGSFGQGEGFARANVKDFGYGDFRDILAGVDEALRVAPVDPQRLGICGWSYGGYMSMWAVTQTNRFKAAMAGAGLSNWQSYYGENLIDQWMIPFFGASVYDDPAVYAKSSPINFIKNAKTPALLLVGDSDGEVPAPQSWEFWHALKTLGVETKLVVYEHEGHAFAKPAHQRDLIARTVAWFDAHLR